MTCINANHILDRFQGEETSEPCRFLNVRSNAVICCRVRRRISKNLLFILVLWFCLHHDDEA